MESVGQKLKTARENKRMTVEDVAAATMMQIQTIIDLDNNNFKSLPPPLYVRGFIKLYAESVGTDPAPLIRAYNNPPVLTEWKSQKQPDKSRKIEPPAPQQLHDSNKREDKIKKPLSISFKKPALPKMPEINFTKIFNFKRFFRAKVQALGDYSTGIKKRVVPKICSWAQNSSKIKDFVKNQTNELSKKISNISMPDISMPDIKLSAKTRNIISIAVPAFVFIFIAVWLITWHVERNRPRLYDSRFITNPPDPYVEEITNL